MAKVAPKVSIPQFSAGDLVFDPAGNKRFIVKSQKDVTVSMIYRTFDGKLGNYDADALSIRMDRAGWAKEIINNEKALLDALVGT
jgi:hypothetical protein